MRPLLLICLLCLPILSFGQSPCVQIFFDRVDAQDQMGKTYSIFLQNLLGHFPEYQQIVAPIQTYRKGGLEKCHASFYIGSNFYSPIPKEFYEDFLTTSRQVAWLGYNTWNAGPEWLTQAFGTRYLGLSKLDWEHLDRDHKPTFYKWVDYKNKTFFKYGDWDRKNPKNFLAGFEITEMEVTEQGTSVLATTRHDFSQEKRPYILQRKNRFFVADVPFSFMHEGDRYHIFADLLFDILQEPPKRKEHLAFIRLEDIHPMISLAYLLDCVKVFQEEKVPVTLSLIPIFFDPFWTSDRKADEEFVTMDRRPQFLQVLRELEQDGAFFIWHGTTHQYKRVKNPHTGMTGDDFEFWDANKGQALGDDSARYVADRLADGWYTLKKSKVRPVAWLTPHYQASPLDYILFGRFFPWNVGRVIYQDTQVRGLNPEDRQTDRFWYFNEDPQTEADRRQLLQNLQVASTGNWNGQMFPYEIYGDVYGQRLLPENLGNSQPYVTSQVLTPRTVDQIISDADRNTVLRDSWASLFYHVQLVNTSISEGQGKYPGDASELRRLIRALKSQGYSFVNLNEFTAKNTRRIRPEPIYVDMPGTGDNRE